MPREEGQRDAAAWGSIQRDPVTFIHFISAARNRKIDREREREGESERATRECQRPLQLRNGEQFCGTGAKREGGRFEWQENEMCWKICKSVV